MKTHVTLFATLLFTCLLPLSGIGQIFQGAGTLNGMLGAVNMCDGKPLVRQEKTITLRQANADSCTGQAGALGKIMFNDEKTEWRGPDTAIRTIDLSCFYTGANYGTDTASCGSKEEFSSILYSTLVIFPHYVKPLWNVSIDISYSGENFLDENVFVRVEVTNDSNSSKSITSLIMPCDDQNAFSGDSPGEIIDMANGKYLLKIFLPDYAALNNKTIRHIKGNLYMKYKIMITGHD